MKSIPPENRTPFNSPRPTSDTPYWLRNGIADLPYIEASIADHRRRLGITKPWHEPWNKLAEERAVTDKLIEDIMAGKISAAHALPALQEWRKQHDAA